VDASTIVLLVAGAYLAVCLIVGLWPSKQASDSVAGYVAGDRGLGPLLMYFITGATIFSAFTFMGFPGLAYSQGAAAFYIFSYGILVLGPRAARVGRVHGFVTQAEMIAFRFDNRAIAGVMAIASTIAFIPYVAVQMQGAGKIVAAISDGRIPEWAGAAFVYLIVLAYVAKSGLMGVGWTNVLQGVLMLSMAWALGLYLPVKMYGGIGAMFERIAAARPQMLTAPGVLNGTDDPWSWSEYTSAVIVSTIGFSAWPHLFMKAYTARDERTLRRAVVLYPTFLLFQVPILLLGFAGVLYAIPPPTRDQIVPHLLMHVGVSPLVVGLFCAGALSAAMGGDAIGHGAASIAVHDGAVRGLGVKLDPLRERRWIRITLVPLFLASFALAMLWKESLVWLLLFAYGPINQFMPAIVAALYSRRATGAGVLAGLAAGVAVNLLFAWKPEWRPWPVHAAIYGLIANVFLLVVVSANTRNVDRGRDDEFLRIASAPQR
jgi:SSS family solute:Na+ symporter